MKLKFNVARIEQSQIPSVKKSEEHKPYSLIQAIFLQCETELHFSLADGEGLQKRED